MVELAEQRRQEILDAIRQEGGVVISRMARKLNVSEMTVRRDLRGLEMEGLLNRVHGGAVAVSSVSYGERLTANTSGKRKAAAKLKRFLPSSGTIYLDGSTTMLSLVPYLREVPGLQVATNNVETFQQLCQIHGVEPVLLGGNLDRRTDNLVGSLAMRSILAIAFEKSFFSCYGLTPRHGPMEATLEDAEVKDLVASRSSHIYLAVDKSKLERVVSGVWQPDAHCATLATDLDPEDIRLKPYKDKFCEIL